jgi:TP901 family phage tail tape measure protein
MASRTIAVRITLDNRDALSATRAQTAVTRELSAATERATHLQSGLTNSFLKGNLAARAISIGFMSIRDATYFVVGGLSSLEMSLAKVRAATGATAETADGLKSAIFKLGRETSSSISDLSNASLELAKLGFSGKELELVLGGVSRLAASLGDSLESTGQLVGGVVNTFDLSAEQAATVADKLFVATGKSAASIASFQVAFGLAGNVAANAGVSFEDLAAAIATMSNQGIKASTIGTGLRTFITNLGVEGSKAQQILGGSVQELGLLGAMEQMAKLKPDTGTIFEMFGKPGSAVASAISNSTDMFKEFQLAVNESNGQLKQGGDIINDTVLGSLTRLKNSLLELTNMLSGGKVERLTTKFFTTLGQGFTQTSDDIDDQTRFNEFLKTRIKEKGSGKEGIRSAATELGFEKGESFTDDDLKVAFLKREAQAKVKEAATKLFNEKMQKEMLKNLAPNPNTGLKTPELLKREKEIERTTAAEEAREDAKKFAKSLVDEKNRKRLRDAEEEKNRTFVKLPNKPLYSMEDQRIGNQNEDTEIMPWLSKPKTPLDKQKKPEAELFSKDKTDELEKFQLILNETSASFTLMGDSAFAALNKSQASFVAMQTAVQGVNGSVDILSSYFIEGIFSEKKDPFKGISDAFGNFAKKMATDLVALSLKILFFRGLLAALSLSTGGAGGALIPFVTQLASATTGTKFASGTDQVVTKPTMFMAGESGKERVTVTPRAKMSSDRSGGGITVNIQGDVLDGSKFTEAVEMAQRRLRGRAV